jgi:undecaprenyl-diphosphatase
MAQASRRSMSSPTERSPTPSRQRTELAIGQALTLGALHGPAELLPISSSGHVALIPWLLGWNYDRLDPELRKAFEVALHAGTAAALLITLRSEVQDALQGMSFRLAGLIGLSFVPPAVVGLTLERQIEQRLGTPATTAAGLICGSIAMVWADRAPQTRSSLEAGAVDALWLGGAQACALIPGVSRNGATLAAARMRRFTREDANRLSPRGAAGDRGGDAAQDGAGRPSRAAARHGIAVRGRRRRVVWLDPGLDLADQAGRARPLAAPLRGLPPRAGRHGPALSAPPSMSRQCWTMTA